MNYEEGSGGLGVIKKPKKWNWLNFISLKTLPRRPQIQGHQRLRRINQARRCALSRQNDQYTVPDDSQANTRITPKKRLFRERKARWVRRAPPPQSNSFYKCLSREGFPHKQGFGKTNKNEDRGQFKPRFR